MADVGMSERCAPYRNQLGGLPFASIIPSRTPAFKLHRDIGRAKSAAAYSGGHWDSASGRYYSGARGGEIYERTERGWELRYRVERGTPTDELPWRKSAE